MANTLGNPTFVSTLLREDQVIAANTRLAAGATIANPILRIRNSTTTLVDFPLNATTPLTVGASDGSGAFNFVGSSAVATGGAATIPDNYQILGRDNTVHLSGPATATDGITSGQTVNNASTTLTAPAT